MATDGQSYRILSARESRYGEMSVPDDMAPGFLVTLAAVEMRAGDLCLSGHTPVDSSHCLRLGITPSGRMKSTTNAAFQRFALATQHIEAMSSSIIHINPNLQK